LPFLFFLVDNGLLVNGGPWNTCRWKYLIVIFVLQLWIGKNEFQLTRTRSMSAVHFAVGEFGCP